MIFKLSPFEFCVNMPYANFGHVNVAYANRESLTTELEQWNANIAFAQVNLSPLADHKRGNWLFPV